MIIAINKLQKADAIVVIIIINCLLTLASAVGRNKYYYEHGVVADSASASVLPKLRIPVRRQRLAAVVRTKASPAWGSSVPPCCVTLYFCFILWSEAPDTSLCRPQPALTALQRIYP